MSERRHWSYYVIDLRRQHVNDRTWYGLGLAVVGFGNLAAGVLPWWVGVPLGLVGLVLMSWGLADRR